MLAIVVQLALARDLVALPQIRGLVNQARLVQLVQPALLVQVQQLVVPHLIHGRVSLV